MYMLELMKFYSVYNFAINTGLMAQQEYQFAILLFRVSCRGKESF